MEYAIDILKNSLKNEKIGLEKYEQFVDTRFGDEGIHQTSMRITSLELAVSKLENTNSSPLGYISGSTSKNDLIRQLLKKLHEGYDRDEKFEYQSKLLCGYGIVTINIKVE